MNIGIDIDDTITNTYETLIPMVAISYGMNIDKLMKKHPTYKELNGTLPNYDDFAKKNYARIAKMVSLKDGVVDIINKLKEDGHNIIFISARNDMNFKDSYKATYEYLTTNGIKFDKLIVNSTNKAKDAVLEGIDLFIDDNTMDCKAVKKKGITALQMRTIFSKGSKEVRKVDNWNEIYKIVQEMYV
jgi:uncharacterized HAD superfamily protein